MLSYKQLLDFSNVLVGVTIESLTNMGLNIPLMWNQMANAFSKEKIEMMLCDMDLSLEGAGVKALADDFAKKSRKSGFVRELTCLKRMTSKWSLI